MKRFRIMAFVSVVLPITAIGCTQLRFSNWAGYVKPSADTVAYGNWRHAWGSFVQPIGHAIPPPTNCTFSEEFSWVGLGGVVNPAINLLQIGTGLSWDTRSGGTPVQQVFAWWEILPDNPTIQPIGDFPLSGGDQVNVDASYNENGVLPGQPPGVVTLTISTNAGSTFSTRKQRSLSNFDGHTAEWIDEAPKINSSDPKRPNGFAYLANFDRVSWTNVYAQEDPSVATPVPLGAGDRQDVGMWFDVFNGHPTPPPLALPYGPSGNTSFTDTWVHC